MFTWSDEYSVGNDEIDAQHQHFFGIVDRFGLADAGKPTEVEALFDALDDYTSVHFTAEEALLEEVGFPGLEKHRGVHGVFLAQVKDLRSRFREGTLDPVLAGELVTRWLSIHIKVMDKTWAEWVRAKAVGDSDVAHSDDDDNDGDSAAGTP